MKIINRFTNETIFECEKTTARETVIEAVKKKANLFGVDLRGVDLSEADLREANLSRVILCGTNFEHTRISFRGKTVEVNFTEIPEEG